jgi:hypothetical protein
MTAHLHRYKSELSRIEYILVDMRSPKFSLTNRERPRDDGGNGAEYDADEIKIQRLMSQLNAITTFSDELERKTQNILTLVSSRPNFGSSRMASTSISCL